MCRSRSCVSAGRGPGSAPATGGHSVIAEIRTPDTTEPTHRAAAPWRRLARRVAGLGLLWWILAGGELESWLVGGPLVGLIAWRSLATTTEPPLRWGPLIRFVPFFARQSLAGAIDVASRALRPAMPLRPGLVRVPLRLPAGAPQVALANVISLLPGTLSASLQSKQVLIHALDPEPELPDRVRDLELRIGAIYGLALEPTAAREER